MSISSAWPERKSGTLTMRCMARTVALLTALLVPACSSPDAGAAPYDAGDVLLSAEAGLAPGPDIDRADPPLGAPTYPNTDITKELEQPTQLVEECDEAMELMLT